MRNILIRELVTWNENFGSEYLRERSKSLSKNQSNKNPTVLKNFNRRFREGAFCEERFENGVKISYVSTIPPTDYPTATAEQGF